MFHKLPYNKIWYSISDDKVYKVGIPIGKNKFIGIRLSPNYSILDYQLMNSINSYTSMGTIRDVYNLITKFEKNTQLTKRMIFLKDVLRKNIVNSY